MTHFTPLEQVCHLPVLFYQGHDNPRQIVSVAGIGRDDLVPGAIVRIVRENPELVSAWLRWSRDKRAAEGWYFQTDETLFIVGFNPEGDRQVFEDGYIACAEFIIKEVTRILGDRLRPT